MKMKDYKKVLAGVLAATMIMGNSVAVFADEGSTSGAGELEGTVSTDVFSVVLPTIADGDTTFDFILDPEGLIQATDADRYNGVTFGTGTLFFANSTGDYSNTSDALTVVNKSSVAVDVSLSATIADAAGITLTLDKTFTDDTSASMYLAIKDADGETAITASGATVSKQIAAAPDGAYEVQWDNTASKYKYVLADEANTTFADYSFQLTGASNANGDWSELSEIAPAVNVVWTVTEHQDKPAITGTKTIAAVADTAVTVNVSLGSGDTAATGIGTLTYVNASGATKTVDASGYSYANGVVTLTAETVNVFVNSANTTRTYTITFNDTAKTTASFILTK